MFLQSLSDGLKDYRVVVHTSILAEGSKEVSAGDTIEKTVNGVLAEFGVRFLTHSGFPYQPNLLLDLPWGWRAQ